ncbi:LTMD1 protein, partial [Amia calva]|nr:LTMD1 protein [Amia calva]
VGSRLKWANEKYESFLQNNFPRFYLLYHTFMTGAKLLFRDAKEMKRIRVKMMRQSQSLQQLPYREVEALRQFRRDVIKAAPMVLISIPPFANYLVFILMYLFPRQLLIRHFWTPQQQMEFQQIYHRQRAQHHAGVLRGLTMAVSNITEKPLQRQLLQLCNKIERGAHPSVSQIHAVRRLFVGPPLGIKRLKAAHMVSQCCQLFLTPRLPAFLIRHRLWGHASELLQLDRALSKLGLHQLSDQELRQACYLRGLDSTRLDVDHCKEWLYNWLQLSTRLKG